jgi:hypothetical protein
MSVDASKKDLLLDIGHDFSSIAQLVELIDAQPGDGDPERVTVLLEAISARAAQGEARVSVLLARRDGRKVEPADAALIPHLKPKTRRAKAVRS